VGATAKKTLLVAVAAWLVTRALRRVVGVAMLAAIAAGALTVANRHGVDVNRVRGIIGCDTRAIARVAQQLGDSASSSSPGSERRMRRAVRELGHCQRQGASSTRRSDRRAAP